jgi:hypothetical protein
MAGLGFLRRLIRLSSNVRRTPDTRASTVEEILARAVCAGRDAVQGHLFVVIAQTPPGSYTDTVQQIAQSSFQWGVGNQAPAAFSISSGGDRA